MSLFIASFGKMVLSLGLESIITQKIADRQALAKAKIFDCNMPQNHKLIGKLFMADASAHSQR